MRRPPLVIAAAGIAVVIAGALLLAVLGPRGTFGAPRADSGAGRPATNPPAVVPASVPRDPVPVILVHGFTGGPAQMQPLADRLIADGRTVAFVDLPDHGTVDINRSALAVGAVARDLHAPVVDVVGFSLGGVAARQWLLQRQPGVVLRHLVMLATPNFGVVLGTDSGNPADRRCGPTNACGQLLPFSPFLRQLDGNPLAQGRPGWLTVASSTDGLVVPPAAVALPGAQNVVLQQICPGVRTDHGHMDDAPEILGVVSLFLADRLPAFPACPQVLAASRV